MAEEEKTKKQLNERKETDDALRETSQYLENLFNYANVPIIVWDPQFKITRFNHAFEVLTGRSADEVVGKSIRILFPADKVERSMELIRDTLGGERWESVEINILHLNGIVWTVLWNSATLFDLDGKTPIATIAQGQDITKHKKAREALRKSEERFKALAENISDWIWEVDENSVFTYSNPKIRELLGYEPNELIGKTLFDLMPPEEAKRVAAEFESLTKGYRAFKSLENANRHKDGRILVLETSGVPIVDNNGEFRGYRGINREITERKKAEREIKQSAEEWQRTFDSIADLIFLQDKDFTITRVNKAFAEALKSKPEDIVGKKCYELLHKMDKPWPGCPFEMTKKDKKAHSQEVDDPNIGVPLLVTTSPIFDDNGELLGSVHIAKDISKQKRGQILNIDKA
ncbi:MAG: PAS domain-containing protein [Elusimicrobiota bacterium]